MLILMRMVSCCALCAGLVEEWCNQISRYLTEAPKDDPKDKFPGPRTLLDFWRGRMTRLTSITEQLKLKEFKNVLQTLNVVSKNDRTEDSLRQSVLGLLRRWKLVDSNITEAANEAKDNVKYLMTMEKFM